MRGMTCVIMISLLVAACGAEDASEENAADEPVATADASSTTTTRLDVELSPDTTKPPLTTPPGDEGISGSPPEWSPGDDSVAFAVADLAFRLGVPEADIVVVEQLEMMWRDGSLGCPQPGFSYTQALVDGSKIVLEHDDTSYSYHLGRGRAPFLCENPAE